MVCNDNICQGFLSVRVGMVNIKTEDVINED